MANVRDRPITIPAGANAGKLSLQERPVRVLRYSPRDSFWDALTIQMQRDPGFELAGEELDSLVLDRLESQDFDVLLVDARFRPNDLDVFISRVRAQSPRTQVLVVFAKKDGDSFTRALRSGARGYLLKTCQTEVCVKAILAVHGGNYWVERKVLEQLLESLLRREAKSLCAEAADVLTPREREIIAHIGNALTNKEIARRMGISDMTVKTHIQHIMRKMHVSRRALLLTGDPLSRE